MTVLLLGRELELGHYRAEYLKSQGVHTIFPETKGAAMAVIRTGGFEVIIVSYTLSDATVKELIDVIEENCPKIPIIAITKQRWEDHLVKPAEIVMDTDPPQALLERHSPRPTAKTPRHSPNQVARRCAAEGLLSAHSGSSTLKTPSKVMNKRSMARAGNAACAIAPAEHNCWRWCARSF